METEKCERLYFLQQECIVQKRRCESWIFFFFCLQGLTVFSCNQDTEGNFRLPGANKEQRENATQLELTIYIYIYVCNSTEPQNRNRNFRIEMTLSILRAPLYLEFSQVFAGGGERQGADSVFRLLQPCGQLITSPHQVGQGWVSSSQPARTHTNTHVWRTEIRISLSHRLEA